VAIVSGRLAVEHAVALEHDLGEKDGGTNEAARGLPQEQLSMLYQNCLKMASENKITKDNTWALPLIDHISDLVQPSTVRHPPFFIVVVHEVWGLQYSSVCRPQWAYVAHPFGK
jgi:hypothetical protein